MAIVVCFSKQQEEISSHLCLYEKHKSFDIEEIHYEKECKCIQTSRWMVCLLYACSM